MYCKFHSLCIYLSCACDCFWVGVKGLSLKHVVHAKQNLRQLLSTSELLSPASPVPVPCSQRRCILKHQLWLCALVFHPLGAHHFSDGSQ